jgi:O-antigen/teichoic acid export membrane protein
LETTAFLAPRGSPARRLHPSVSAIAKGLGRVRKRAFGLVSREHILSLADQAIVSATGFLTTFLIVRWSGPTQLGIYALGLSLLLSVMGFQDSLILQPYQIQRFYPEGTPAERAGASLTLSILFSAGSILVLTVAALGFMVWHAGPEIVVMTWAIAGILPFALTRDFARRFAFAHLNAGRVLVLDLAAAIIQLSALSWLGASGRMSALGACAALGAACALPTALWFYSARTEFTFRLRHLRTAFTETWALGKWLLTGRITIQVQQYVTYWLAAALGGAAVTGVYAACMSIIGFANPMMVGLTNTFMPKAVLAWKHHGGPGLWHETIRNTTLIAAVMAAFSLAVILAGESVMRILYHGKEFEGHDQTLVVLALATSLGALGTPSSIALATMKRPRSIVMITIVETVLTVVLVWVLMTEWGLLGAAYAMLVGNVVGSVARWVALFVRVPKVCDPEPVMRVLQEFTKCVDSSHCTVTRIGGERDGDAEIFIINSVGPQPIWRTDNAVVVKLYKPEAPFNFETVQAQIDSLSNLHAVLDGRQINGWRISVPRLLYVCKSPLAVVMTAVPGQSIGSYTSRSDVLTPRIFLEAARTFAMAMEQCWSSGRRHGDLHLGNILFDIEAKNISIIDPGWREDCRVCNDVTKFKSAAVADLTHVLWELAIDAMDLIRGPTVRFSQETFIENVLLSIVEGIDSREEKRRLLNEIWGCAQQHLTDRIERPWSLKGVWNRFVGQVAMGRIRSILERVNSHANVCTGRADKVNFERAMQSSQ